jgi:hypothetical protein|nr:MAG TPA: hypothetical protein [Caudoviricetes sp.]
MKTLKEEVMELLMERIGVAENEEFEARLASGECEVNKFCNGELLTKFSKEWRDDLKWAVFVKYFDVYEFKVIPFKPKKHEGYWFIDVYGSLCFTQFSSLITFNALNRAIGNCFRTKESAEAHREEILKILKGEDDE